MTYAKAVAALVEFAQNVSADNNADCNGWATPARAALATWRVRPRLRDDDKAVAAIALWLVAVGVPDGEVFPRARDIADAIEQAMFPREPGPEGGSE